MTRSLTRLLAFTLLSLLTLTGCSTLRTYTQRHPILTGLATAALVGSLAWNASTDYSRYWRPGKPCQSPEGCR